MTVLFQGVVLSSAVSVELSSIAARSSDKYVVVVGSTFEGGCSVPGGKRWELEMREGKSSRSVRHTILALTAVAALISVWMVGGPADAETVEIPIEQTVIEGTPGSTVEIGSADVPADLVGETCEITVEVVNQESIHGGNKLIVTSDGSTVEVEGIEDAAGSTTTVAGTITLGSTIDVAVYLAVDDISSLGSSLTVTCTPLPPPPPPPPPPTTVPVYTG